MLHTSRRVLIAGLLAAGGLSGCYVVPVASDGTPIYPAAAVYPAVTVPTVQGPGPNYGAPVVGRSVRAVPAQQPVPAADAAAMPVPLQARLYPANDVATETGMLSGTVTNMMTGKGMFQLNYRGETMAGEATRVPGDERRGIANAYGRRGTYMNCDYRMTTPYQGTGTCNMSNGAQYQVHIGG